MSFISVLPKWGGKTRSSVLWVTVRSYQSDSTAITQLIPVNVYGVSTFAWCGVREMNKVWSHTKNCSRVDKSSKCQGELRMSTVAGGPEQRSESSGGRQERLYKSRKTWARNGRYCAKDSRTHTCSTAWSRYLKGLIAGKLTSREFRKHTWSPALSLTPHLVQC